MIGGIVCALAGLLSVVACAYLWWLAGKIGEPDNFRGWGPLS